MEKAMKKIYSFLLLLTFLFTLSGCGCLRNEESPMTAPILHTPGADYNFEIHSLSAPGTEAALIFCDGEAMLASGSDTLDLQLVADYLETKSISRLRYAFYLFAPEETLLSRLPADRVYSAERTQNPAVYFAMPDAALPLGESTITFIREEHGTMLQATYRNSPYRIPLNESGKKEEYVGSPAVTVMRPSPDGTYTEIRRGSPETEGAEAPVPSPAAYRP